MKLSDYQRMGGTIKFLSLILVSGVLHGNSTPITTVQPNQTAIDEELDEICCPWKEKVGEKYRYLNYEYKASENCCVYEKMSQPGSKHCFPRVEETKDCFKDYEGFEMINPQENPLTFWTISVGGIRHGPGEIKIGDDESNRIVTGMKKSVQSYNIFQSRITKGIGSKASIGNILQAFESGERFEIEESGDSEVIFEHWTSEGTKSTVERENAMKTNIEVSASLTNDDIFLIAFEMKLYVYEIDGLVYHLRLATGQSMSGNLGKSTLEKMYLDDSFSGVAELYNLHNVYGTKEMVNMIKARKLDFILKSPPQIRTTATTTSAPVSTSVQIVSLTGADNYKVSSTGTSIYPDTPFKREYAAAGFIDNTLLLCGGYDSGAKADCFQIGQNGGWKTGPTMNERRYAFTITNVGNKLVVTGGQDENYLYRFLDSTEILENDGWKYGPTLSLPRDQHCAVAISDHEVIFIGGYLGGYHSGYLTLTEKFDILTGESVQLASLKVATYGVSCGMLDEKRIIKAGGAKTMKVVEILDISPGVTSNWYPIPEMPGEIYRGFLFLIGGEIKVYGNEWNSGAFHVFTPGNAAYTVGKWTSGTTSFNNPYNVRIAVPSTFRQNP